MTVAHNFPSQRNNRSLMGGLKGAGLALGGLCALVLIQPLGVSAETEHRPAELIAPIKQIAEQPAPKTVRVIQIWNLPDPQKSQN